MHRITSRQLFLMALGIAAIVIVVTWSVVVRVVPRTVIPIAVHAAQEAKQLEAHR